MADRTVTVRISAQDSFSSVVSRYNTAMGQAETTTRRVSNANKEAGGSFDGLGRSIGGAVAAIGAMQVVQFGVEMFQLGTQVDVAAQNFGTLTADIGGAEATLNTMRTATHGALNDLELMSAANNFLALGLATTAEEMATMSQQAIQLGGAVGTGPVQAIETLQRALRNQSFEMLDSLGVSAARVRVRVLELKDAGVDMSEAFRRATLEQLDAGVERLGASADAAFRPTDILLSRLESFQQAAARNIAQGIDGIALAILNLDKVVVAADNAGTWDILGSLVPGGVLTGAAIGQAGQISLASGAGPGFTPTALPFAAMPTPGAGGFLSGLQGAQHSAMMSDAFSADFERLQSLTSQGAGLGSGEGFFSRDQADAMRGMAERAGMIADEWERMAETNPVDETRLENMRGMADALDITATNAERSARALEQMSLAQMMGQTGGGRQGELGDLVLGGMDVAEDEMSALRDALDLASGRQTELSQTVRDDLVPILQRIGEEEGPEALAEAVAAFEEAMTERTQAGESPMDTNAWLQGVLGGGLGRSAGRGEESAGAIDSEALMTALGESANSMMTMAADSTTIQGAMAEITPGVETIHGLMPDVVGGFADVAGKSTVFAEKITIAHDLLAEMASKVNIVKIEIRPNAPAWAIAMFSGAASGAAFIASVVGAAGGQVPGATDR